MVLRPQALQDGKRLEVRPGDALPLILMTMNNNVNT